MKLKILKSYSIFEPTPPLSFSAEHLDWSSDETKEPHLIRENFGSYVWITANFQPTAGAD